MRASSWGSAILSASFLGCLFAAPNITRILPPVGQPGDVVTISGTGFGTNPALLNVRFGPNRAPALTASPSQITVQVPNGQPLGLTQVTVSSSNGLTFITGYRSKIPMVPNNPKGCGPCPNPCDCTDTYMSPCPSTSFNPGPPLGGSNGGDVSGNSGEFDQTATDLAIPGRPGASGRVQYRLTRVYRSLSNGQSPLGSKWDHIYFDHLVIEGDGSVVHDDGLGRNDHYLLNNQGKLVAPPEFYTRLTKNPDASYTMRYQDGTTKHFDQTGKITQIADRNGNALSFSYDAQNRLQTVNDTLGRPIAYSYDSNGRLQTVADFTGRTVTYGYDSAGNLVSVTSPAVTGTPNGNDFPSGKTTRYTYDSNHMLLTVTRPNEVVSGGGPVLTNVYDSSGRIVQQTYGGTNTSGVAAGGSYSYTYTPLNAGVTSDDPNLPVMRTQQTDPNGNVTQYDYNRLGYPLAIREFTRGIRPTDPAAYVTSMTYNADGRMTQTTMPAGNITQYQYDDGNADRFQEGNLLTETRLPDATRGGDQSFITTTYTYEPVYNHIATMTEPRGNDPSYVPQNGGAQSAARYTTTYTYDGTGNLTMKQQPTVALPGGTSQLIETDYTYNSFGQMTSETDPEGNVTQYQYCPTATPTCASPSPPGGGYLQQKITDAVSSPRRTETTPPVAITQQYFYDAVGNTVRTIDGRGHDVLYTVNQLNELVEAQSEAPFRYITYTFYDANDNVVQRNVENQVPTTSDGKPIFTAGGNFTSADGTPAFFVTRYTYDIFDNMVTDDEDATDSTPPRDVTQYRYDPNRNRTQVTQPAGNVVRMQYDERNLLFTETRGYGSSGASTMTSNYDVNRNLASSVNGRGFVTGYRYDGYDREAQAIDAVGGQSITHYDPASNIVSSPRYGQPGGPSPPDNSGVGNVLLRRQTFEYDELSRRYQLDDQPVNGTGFVASGVTTSRPPSVTPGPLNPGAISTQTVYDRNGRATQQIEDDLAATAIQYDGVNRRVLATDPLGNTVQTSYDANSNLIQTVETDISQKNGVASETFTTTYQYDSRNRQTSVSDNCSNTRRGAYDSRNNPTNTTDAKSDNTTGCSGSVNLQGNSTRYTYDGLSRRLQSMQDLRIGGIGSGAIDTTNAFNPSGQIMASYTYDANGRRTAITDNNENTTRYVYDALNRQVSETLADNSVSVYNYDLDDNLLSMTDNNGTVRNNSYDAVDRLTQTAVAPAAGIIGTTANTYQYDGLSRTTRLTDNNDPTDPTSASAVTFAYDVLSRVVEETQNGKAVDGAWSAQARRTALTYPNSRQINFTYDLLERIQTIKDNGAATNIAQYTYIGPQRVLQRQYQNGTQLTHLDNAGVTDTGFDGLRRTVMRRDLRSDNSLIVGFGHAYDRQDNKSYEAKLHSTSNSELYNYDSAYRIIDFQRGQLNGTNTGIVTPSATEDWTLDGVGNWRIDAVNGVPGNRAVNPVNEYTNINGGPLVYDPNGNLTAANLGYRWDYKNRLRQVCSLPANATSCTAPGAQVLATYSYDAVNRRTRKVVTNSGSFDGTTNFYYDGWRTIEERDGANAVVRQYVYGRDIDEPLILDPNGGPRLFYHQNTLSSTFALTDAGGNVVEGYEYDAYGRQTVFGAGFGTVIGTASAVGNPYMYTGQRFDPETGLYYYRARYYDASQGRFLQRDPLGFDGGVNFYEYVLSRPTRYTDAYGLEISEQPKPDYSYADDIYKYHAQSDAGVRRMVDTLKKLRDRGGCPTVTSKYVTTEEPAVGVPEFATDAGKKPCTISLYFGHGAKDDGSVEKVKEAIGGKEIPKVADGKDGACMAPRYGVYSCWGGRYNGSIDLANRFTAFDPEQTENATGERGKAYPEDIAKDFNKRTTLPQIEKMCKCCGQVVELRLYFGSYGKRNENTPKATPFSKW
jgi:RHS repeat-associated protein